jgi:hypothetical protein
MGIIVAMSVTGYMYFQYSVIPMKNKLEEQAKVMVAQDLRDQEQQAAIAAIQANVEKTTKANAVLQQNNQQYETEMADYLDVFRRHNITKLASAKPGMMQKRANEKTEAVFNEIEDISKRIHTLND